jgi:hypothetical protein
LFSSISLLFNRTTLRDPILEASRVDLQKRGKIYQVPESGKWYGIKLQNLRDRRDVLMYEK